MNRQEFIFIVTASAIFSCIATVLDRNFSSSGRRWPWCCTACVLSVRLSDLLLCLFDIFDQIDLTLLERWNCIPYYLSIWKYHYHVTFKIVEVFIVNMYAYYRQYQQYKMTPNYFRLYLPINYLIQTDESTLCLTPWDNGGVRIYKNDNIMDEFTQMINESTRFYSSHLQFNKTGKSLLIFVSE